MTTFVASALFLAACGGAKEEGMDNITSGYYEKYYDDMYKGR